MRASRRGGNVEREERQERRGSASCKGAEIMGGERRGDGREGQKLHKKYIQFSNEPHTQVTRTKYTVPHGRMWVMLLAKSPGRRVPAGRSSSFWTGRICPRGQRERLTPQARLARVKWKRRRRSRVAAGCGSTAPIRICPRCIGEGRYCHVNMHECVSLQLECDGRFEEMQAHMINRPPRDRNASAVASPASIIRECTALHQAACVVLIPGLSGWRLVRRTDSIPA